MERDRSLYGARGRNPGSRRDRRGPDRNGECPHRHGHGAAPFRLDADSRRQGRTEIRKINIKSTDGISFKDRLGNVVEVFDLKAGDTIAAYRLETRPAPVTITISEVEEIKAAEPAAPAPAPEPAAAPAPAPEPEPRPEELPSTASPLPWILLLGLLSLAVGLALGVARRRA
jgi:LPXTG-motif cell wall-anchored protein